MPSTSKLWEVVELSRLAGVYVHSLIFPGFEGEDHCRKLLDSLQHEPGDKNVTQMMKMCPRELTLITTMRNSF
jgi:hypothetical protein